MHVILHIVSKANRKQCNRLAVPHSYVAFAGHLESDNCLAILCMEDPKIYYYDPLQEYSQQVYLCVCVSIWQQLEKTR